MNRFKIVIFIMLVVFLLLAGMGLRSTSQDGTAASALAAQATAGPGLAESQAPVPYFLPMSEETPGEGVVTAAIKLVEATITALTVFGNLTIEGLNKLYQITPEFLRCFFGLGILIILILAGIGASTLRMITGIRNRYLE